VTQDHDQRDIVLERGDQLIITTDGDVLVTALGGCASVSVCTAAPGPL